MIKYACPPNCQSPWVLPASCALFLCALLCALPRLPAQDTLHTLPLLTVQAFRMEQTGFKRWKSDSLPTINTLTLADRLRWESPLALRITAPGALASISIRGAGAARSPVYWNGLPLLSPMNGTADVSLLPLWPDDALALYQGGQSAALGSSAMGGALLLNHNWQQNPGFSGQMGLSRGSFGNLSAQSTLGFSHGAWQSNSQAFFQRAENNFPFTNYTLPGRPPQRQQNNGLEKFDIQEFLQFKPNKYNQIRFSGWYTRASREIPQPITSSPKTSWQKDRDLRSSLEWQFIPSRKGVLQTRIGYLDEWIAFHLSGDTDSSHARTLVANTRFLRHIGPRFTLQLGANNTRQWAQSDGYADTLLWYHQNRTALYWGGEWQNNRLKISGMARKEWAKGQKTPFTWSLGGVYAPCQYAQITFHGSRNFNLPTFNDRFWKAWGQSNLRSENGYSTDLSLKLYGPHWSFENTAFYLNIDDWILWQPGNDGIFRPGNLKKVASRGLESALDYQVQWRNWHFQTKAQYQRCYTTNVAVYNTAESSLHKQLVYVPLNSASAQIRLGTKQAQFAYVHSFTGKRFVQTDNSRHLPAFSVGTFLLSARLCTFKNTQLDLEARLENCWNRTYSYLENQPMPGRSGSIGIRAKWGNRPPKTIKNRSNPPKPGQVQ